MRIDREWAMDFFKRYHKLNRTAVCDETNSVAEHIAEELDGDLITALSGEECLTWIIPDRWKVNSAFIKDPGGDVLIDFKDCPLHLVSYSRPFKGELDLSALKAHLYSDPSRPDRIPYKYSYQYSFNESGWGFCLPHKMLNSLEKGKYTVVVDTSFENGCIKVSDCRIKGEREDTILICAHNCHPSQVNDGLSSIAVAVELFRALKKRDRNRYSYRLVIGPEYYSGAAFLSKAEGVERIKGGVYLDMLGVDTPLGASLSFNGDTYMDKAAKNAIAAVDDKAFFVPYRELWGNDELFYDGPDFHIPMVCVGRKSFSYYHTDKDDIGNCDMTGLDSAYDALDRFINILENDYVPVRKYKGPLYLSKYDLSADFKTERGLSLDLDKMQILMDGDRSCLRIADDLGVEFELVYDFAKKLQQLGLVEGKECEPFHE